MNMVRPVQEGDDWKSRRARPDQYSGDPYSGHRHGGQGIGDQNFAGQDFGRPDAGRRHVGHRYPGHQHPQGQHPQGRLQSQYPQGRHPQSRQSQHPGNQHSGHQYSGNQHPGRRHRRSPYVGVPRPPVTRRRQAGKLSLTVALALLVAFAVIGVGAAAVLTGTVTVGGVDGQAKVPQATAPTQAKTKPTPSPTPKVQRLAGPVLAERQAAALPTKEGLAAALGPILASPALGSHVSVAVRDVASGRLLYGKDPHGAYIPASTTKILTCVAALAALGPDHRFETKVVAGAAPDQIVLVGGGDPFLATEAARKRATGAKAYPVPATIEDLAARTAKELRAAGTTRVRVLVDDTLFRDQASPTWESQYIPTGVVARLSALWVDEAKLSWPAWQPRAKDPALNAADAFVAALERAGITTVGEPTRGRAPAQAGTIASILSPRLDAIVERVMLISDNDGAEVLAHHVALAEGKPATFEGAAAAVKAVLGRLGVESLDQIRLYDGSGLSRDGRLSANVLTETLVAAARPEFPELRAVLTGLPVAGYDGSLEKRFYHEPSDPGVGIVRAKTGTLSGVSSLAGVVTTRDGAVLAFALLTDKATTGDPRPPLDELAAALAECGCQ